jgi:hypothetical protein
VAVNKAKHEETKPVVVCNYNSNMGAMDLKDQMLQTKSETTTEGNQVVFEIIPEITQCSNM